MDPTDWLDRLPPATAARPRLVGVDGFSGSGKTTLAAALGARPGVTVVSLEIFSPGWSGLAAGVGRALDQLVVPLLRGETPVVRPWDWEHDREGVPTRLEASGVVVLEGCGAGAGALRRHQDLTVWVEADAAARDRRLRARGDWALYAPHRSAWGHQEQALEARERTAAHADLVVTVDPDGGAAVVGGVGGGPDRLRSGP